MNEWKSLSVPWIGTQQETPYLILGIEVDATPSVERNISKSTSLVPAPREHRQGHGNGNIDSNLTHVDFPLVFPSSSTRLSEDGGSVAVLVLVDDLESLIQSLSVDDNEDGSEDLFLVAFHRGVGFNDGRSDEVSVGISFHLDVTSVQEDFSALRLSGGYKPEDAVFGSGGDDGAPANACINNAAQGRNKTYRSVLGSKPPLTRSFEARSMRPGRNSLASPTRTATEIAIHR